MTSFYQVIEQMDCGIALESTDNSKAISAIRAGINLRPDFWDDFIKICNQAHVLSELLGIRKEVIAQWPHAVREALSQVEKMDNAEAISKKATLITTGY